MSDCNNDWHEVSALRNLSISKRECLFSRLETPVFCSAQFSALSIFLKVELQIPLYILLFALFAVIQNVNSAKLIHLSKRAGQIAPYSEGNANFYEIFHHLFKTFTRTVLPREEDGNHVQKHLLNEVHSACVFRFLTGVQQMNYI